MGSFKEQIKRTRYNKMVLALARKHLADPTFFVQFSPGRIKCGFERPDKRVETFLISNTGDYYYIFDGQTAKRNEFSTLEQVMEYLEG